GDAEPLVDLGPPLVVDPGHHVVDPEGLARHPGGDDVGIVAAADGHEGGGGGDAGLFQYASVEADPGHPPTAESRAQPAERLRVPIDDGDGMAVVLQDVRQGGPHPATAHDHYMHAPPP